MGLLARVALVPTRRAPARKALPRVLLVGDEARLRGPLRELAFGFDAVLAINADLALATLARRPIDAVVCDGDAPGERGLRLLLDVTGSYPAVRRLLLSRRAPLTFAEHLESTLVEALLSDPLDPDALHAALHEEEPAASGVVRMHCAR